MFCDLFFTEIWLHDVKCLLHLQSICALANHTKVYQSISLHIGRKYSSSLATTLNPLPAPLISILPHLRPPNHLRRRNLNPRSISPAIIPRRQRKIQLIRHLLIRILSRSTPKPVLIPKRALVIGPVKLRGEELISGVLEEGEDGGAPVAVDRAGDVGEGAVFVEEEGLLAAEGGLGEKRALVGT